MCYLEEYIPAGYGKYQYLDATLILSMYLTVEEEKIICVYSVGDYVASLSSPASAMEAII